MHGDVMHPFKQLAVWRKAHDLAQRVFRTTGGVDWRVYPGLAAHMQRSAFATAYSIVEGTGRETPAQFAHSLDAAIGSAHELEYQLLLAKDLGALDTAEHARLEARVVEVHRMLFGLRKTVVARTARPARAARRAPSR
jgi:four helix bundle protein